MLTKFMLTKFITVFLSVIGVLCIFFLIVWLCSPYKYVVQRLPSVKTIEYYHPNYHMDDRTNICFADGPSYTAVPCTKEVMNLVQ
jgi:hypothetical protein